MNTPRTNAFKNKVGEEECEDILKMGCVERELWMCRIRQMERMTGLASVRQVACERVHKRSQICDLERKCGLSLS